MKGLLIYAFNNDSIDYFQQAVWCADRANKYLGLPVTIATDKKSQDGRNCWHDIIFCIPESGGRRIYSPNTSDVSDDWINGNRYQSFFLSPYDQTIVLDSDYVINSDQLLTLFDSNLELAVMKNVYDITGRNGFHAYQDISHKKRLHHFWATVIYFTKSAIAKDFFDMLILIKNNYIHYANLYSFPSSPFRNDFASSIALNTLYGHVPKNIPTIPWAMANVFSDVDISMEGPTTFGMTYPAGTTNNYYKRILVKNQDFHFMNKLSLARLYVNS